VYTSMTSASVSFTEELRSAAGEQWERVVGHKFTIELAKGEIDRNGKKDPHQKMFASFNSLSVSMT